MKKCWEPDIPKDIIADPRFLDPHMNQANERYPKTVFLASLHIGSMVTIPKHHRIVNTCDSGWLSLRPWLPYVYPQNSLTCSRTRFDRIISNRSMKPLLHVRSWCKTARQQFCAGKKHMKKHAPNHHTRSHATSPSKQRNSLPERHLAGCQKTLPHIPSAQRSSLLNKTWHETKPFPTKGTTLLTGGNNYINTYDVHAKNTNPYCNFPVTGPTNKQRSHALYTVYTLVPPQM